MKAFLILAQIAISTILIILILLQSQGAGIGTIFGGSDSFYRSKRGVEKLFVYLTIFFIILFFIVSVVGVTI
ncbi:preprotein translocase subunit SecG [Candidatus Curtissbacteria bacterium]|nr:preprotein translocase subunit SecG [Candidatus Curtissbacteria bacterium]